MEIDKLAVGEEFYRAAARVLVIVNGIGQAGSSNFRPVSRAGQFQEGDGNEHQVVFAETAEARGYAYAAAVVTDPDGHGVPSRSSPGPEHSARPKSALTPRR